MTILFAAMIIELLIVVWVYQNRDRPKRKRKKKRAPEGVWLRATLENAIDVYGIPYKLFILASLWDTLTETERAELKLYRPTITNRGLNDLTIITITGLRLDYNRKQKRG